MRNPFDAGEAMTTTHRTLFSLMGSMICIFWTGVAQAGIPKAFVSTAGSDSNPCFDTKPCRTINRALMVVDPGGEIVAQTSGGYSPQFTITQSVTIDAGGNDASIKAKALPR